MKHYTKSQPNPSPDLQALFDEAMDRFPYPDKQTTGFSHGSLEPTKVGTVEYSEEYTFDVGRLFDERLEAGGWIDVRKDNANDELTITGLFTVARNGDFEKSLIFPEGYGVNAYYDPKAKSWQFETGYY